MSALIPAMIDSLRTTKDKSIKFTVETQELDPTAKQALFELDGKFGWFRFDEAPFSEELVDPPPIKRLVGAKSQSERIRGVLYLLWEKFHPNTDFETFYKQRTDAFIDSLKEKLN